MDATYQEWLLARGPDIRFVCGGVECLLTCDRERHLHAVAEAERARAAGEVVLLPLRPKEFRALEEVALLGQVEQEMAERGLGDTYRDRHGQVRRVGEHGAADALRVVHLTLQLLAGLGGSLVQGGRPSPFVVDSTGDAP